MGLHGEVSKLKPSRSDAGDELLADERQRHSEELQKFLKSKTPSRALKPSRSESGEVGVSAILVPTVSGDLERARLQALGADGKVLRTDGGVVNDDEYMETTYYDGLNSVDKTMHHETGTGFIKRGEGGLAFTIGTDPQKVFRTTNKTNPATNDWEPAPPVAELAEAKVHRSDP